MAASLAVLPLPAICALAVFECLAAPELELNPAAQTWNALLAYSPFIIGIALALTASFWTGIGPRLGRWRWLLAAILALVDLAEIGATIAVMVALSF